jgi:short-subunit dehydrogenase
MPDNAETIASAAPPTVVVTGGSAGVGRAVAELYARRGARLGVIARDADRLAAAADALAELGAADVRVAAVDVADANAVAAAAGTFSRELGPLDVWVNAAMATVYSPFERMTAEEFERVTRVVYLGTVNGTRAALVQMRPRNKGAVVCIGSGIGYRAIPLQSAYCASKFALRGFLEALHAELIHDRVGVSLSVVQLPAMNTPQFEWARSRLPHRPRPAGTPFQPEVAARAVARAAERGTRELFVGTDTLKLVAGGTMAPGYLDRRLATTMYAAQQTDEPVPAGRRDNLFEPVAGHASARGRFGKGARDHAFVVAGDLARYVAIGLGAAGFLLVGLLLGLALA